MTATVTCPKCGTALATDAPAGLCPKCLVEAGFESQGQPQPEFAATSPSAKRRGFEPPSVADLARRFPQFEILELLGKGGMGAVYKARQPGLDRLVAVKILPPEVGAQATFAERFTREARALAKLSHPNIVGVHDFGQVDGLYYFVMEYVEGVNLRQALQAGQMNPPEALAIVPQICDALQFAHDEGVVHRDIKPENILIDKRGRVKIADFGLAKLLDHDADEPNLTATEQVMGTPRYMAPEQMEGAKEVDHRADIYSLGVVFYELLTGELPVGRFTPPSKMVQVDVRLDEVVLRALERKPEQRYQHASDVKADVQSVMLGQPARLAPPALQQIEREVLAYLPRLPIHAITCYRNLTGVTLIEARAKVTEIAARHGMTVGNPQARWWNVLGIVLLTAAAAYFLLRLEVSRVVWMPLAFAVFVVPYTYAAWKYRGLHRGRREAMLAGFWLFILVMQLGIDPASLLTRAYEATGVNPGKNDLDFLAGLFLLTVFGVLFWLIGFWYRLQLAKPKRAGTSGPVGASLPGSGNH